MINSDDLDGLERKIREGDPFRRHDIAAANEPMVTDWRARAVLDLLLEVKGLRRQAEERAKEVAILQQRLAARRRAFRDVERRAKTLSGAKRAIQELGRKLAEARIVAKVERKSALEDAVAACVEVLSRGQHHRCGICDGCRVMLAVEALRVEAGGGQPNPMLAWVRAHHDYEPPPKRGENERCMRVGCGLPPGDQAHQIGRTGISPSSEEKR